VRARRSLVAALAEIKVLVISQAREDERPWSGWFMRASMRWRNFG